MSHDGGGEPTQNRQAVASTGAFRRSHKCKAPAWSACQCSRTASIQADGFEILQAAGLGTDTAVEQEAVPIRLDHESRGESLVQVPIRRWARVMVARLRSPPRQG